MCHGPDDQQRQADLRLDTSEGALSVISPRDPLNSELLRRTSSSDPDLLMPPPDTNRRLSAAELDILNRWIRAGAEWETHWAFEGIHRPDVPLWPDVPSAASDDFPVRNPIDHFVRQQLRNHQLNPAAEADRRTLIRRVSLDLTGLPPTLEEVRAFVRDESPRAYERLVDRLLASPAYGERLAWDWLDAARYADSNGYQGDNDRTMWPWRDWVVNAFNENLPFDQFTVWQLAGDLLPNSTHDQQLATGFCRNHMINGEGGRIPEENRVDYVMDMTETVGTVWLGLTLNCCRCHDHKFDPLSQSDYYQLFAFFNQTPVDGSGGNPQTPPVLEVPDDTQQRRLLEINLRIDAVAGQSEELESLKKQRQELQRSVPKVMVMADQPQERPTFVLDRGLYNEPTSRKVSAALPATLSGSRTTVGADLGSPNLNRYHLAEWLVSDENPLTARVTVNRFWQQLFGVGLVKTSEDFGIQGEYPVQRELLDWLSAEFRESGWNVRHVLRLIVTSHVYRQSSENRETPFTDESGRRLSLVELDPENRLLARGSRYRLPSWMLRDQALAVSGLLSRRRGGAPVNTYQPAGVWEEATFGNRTYQQHHGADLYRRSLYVFWRRIIGPTMFFDNAARQTCTVKVLRTNTPLHALLTLNDTVYVESARVLAEQVLRQPDLTSDQQRLQMAVERVLGRLPGDAETVILLSGLDRSLDWYLEQPDAAARLLSTGDSAADQTLSAAPYAAWTSLCLALLNLDETLCRE